MSDETNSDLNAAADAAAQDQTIARVLKEQRVVHMVGLSAKPDRDSHKVAAYLRSHGYRIIAINPTVEEVLGERAYPSLEAAQAAEPVHLVDVFRKGEALPGLVDELEALPELQAVWLQLGVRNDEAEARLAEFDVDLVVDRCIKIEHAARLT